MLVSVQVDGEALVRSVTADFRNRIPVAGARFMS